MDPTLSTLIRTAVRTCLTEINQLGERDHEPRLERAQQASQVLKNLLECPPIASELEKILHAERPETPIVTPY